MSIIENIDKQPLVSIIMNCYNGEKFLREAIDSVYSQTYKNWEIIFWDNDSTDNSAKIAKSFDSKLRYFKSQKTISLGQARNKALNECKGNFIAFLDCDDLWLNEKLDNQMDIMATRNDIIVCYSNGYFLDGLTKTKNKFSDSVRTKFYRGDIFKHLILLNFINWQTVIINKKLAGGKLFFNPKLTFAEDYEILLRLSLKGKFEYIDIPLTYYRKHDNNLSNNNDIIIEEFEIIAELFKNELIENKININKSRSLLYGSIIKRLIKQGDDFKAKIYLSKYPSFQNCLTYLFYKIKNKTFINT